MPHKILGAYVEFYWDLQKVRISNANRLRTLESEIKKGRDQKGESLYHQLGFLADHVAEIQKSEEDIAEIIEDLIRDIPIWKAFLQDVKGIGPLYAAQLIHLIEGKKHTPECKEKQKKYFSKKKPGEKRKKRFTCDCPEMEIERFSMPSSLHKYAGQHVVDGKAPRRKRGQKVDWNPKLKALCWKISKSFVMSGGFYRMRYNQFKKQETEKNGGKLSKRHIDNRARRKTVKLFLTHLFAKWYELKGLKPPEPYAMSMLGHKGYIPPPE